MLNNGGNARSSALKSPIGARRMKTDIHLPDCSITRHNNNANSIKSRSGAVTAAAERSSQIPPAPARTARLLQRARASPPPTGNVPGGGSRRTPALRPPPHHQLQQQGGGGAESDHHQWLDRTAHNAMLQDVVGIKTMLLKLKRVLHETDTLNPFDRQPSPRHHATSGSGFPSSFATSGASSGSSSGIDPGEAGSDPESNLVTSQPGVELADLRRQVVFLQTQLEDKERTVQLLQLQMTKYAQNRSAQQQQLQPHSNPLVTSYNGHSASSDEDKSCNAATQTERIRPISTGPTTYQQLGEANGLISATSDSGITTTKTNSCSSCSGCSSNSNSKVSSVNYNSSSLPRAAPRRQISASTGDNKTRVRHKSLEKRDRSLKMAAAAAAVSEMETIKNNGTDTVRNIKNTIWDQRKVKSKDTMSGKPSGNTIIIDEKTFLETEIDSDGKITDVISKNERKFDAKNLNSENNSDGKTNSSDMNNGGFVNENGASDDCTNGKSSDDSCSRSNSCSSDSCSSVLLDNKLVIDGGDSVLSVANGGDRNVERRFSSTNSGRMKRTNI